MDENCQHISVLLSEVIQYLKPEDGKVYIDATFGAGGYTKAILESADCTVIGVDRDPSVVKFASKMQEKYSNRFLFANDCFDQFQEVIKRFNISKVDGVVFDFGVSSMQIDSPERGFSFSKNGPLDMRMGDQDLSAYDVVNSFPEKEIADIIYQYGEERKSRGIAKAIVSRRKEKLFETTEDLASVVRSVVRFSPGIDPATRTFQALRIYVNDELGCIVRALNSLSDVMNKNGIVVAVSFHSLEDRIVKRFFKSKVRPESEINQIEILTKKPVVASREEMRMNPRSRSAKLRAAMYYGE